VSSFGNYLAVLAVAAILGSVIVSVLGRPLFNVVAELCGTRARATFWTAYLATLLILVPLLFASWIGAELDLGRSLERGITWMLVGLIGALIVIGWAIWLPSHRLVPEAPKPGAAE
jgi:hypothetical protein